MDYILGIYIFGLMAVWCFALIVGALGCDFEDFSKMIVCSFFWPIYIAFGILVLGPRWVLRDIFRLWKEV